MKRKKKSSIRKKIKKYRSDKRISKRVVTSINIDRGSFEEQIKVSFPQEAEITEVFIPKERNPNLVTIKFDNSKLCWYSNEERGFVYTLKGNYLGNIYKHDLKKLFSEIGHLLRQEKR